MFLNDLIKAGIYIDNSLAGHMTTAWTVILVATIPNIVPRNYFFFFMRILSRPLVKSLNGYA